METIINLSPSDILYSLSALFALIGTILIMYAENKKIKTITETPADTIGPMIIKDYKIDPRLIAKRKFYDPHNRKMKKIKIIGIIILILVPIMTIAAIIIPKIVIPK